jgi:hypothetical protein
MRKSMKYFVLAAAVMALAMSSCRKDAAPPVGGPELEEVGAIKLPQGVVAFGSVKSLADITTAATDIGSAFNKGIGPLIGGQVSAMIQAKLIGTRNLTWMDPTAPMKVVVLDPAKFKTPFVFIGAVAYEDGLMSALDEPQKGVDGNKLSYKGKNGRTMYVNRIGKFAVFTMDPAIYATIHDFLKTDLLRHPGTQLVDIQAAAAGFKNTVKPFIDARMAGVDMRSPNAVDLINAELAEMIDFLDQASAVRITLRFENGNLTVEGSALPVEGSSIAKFAVDSQTRKLSLFKKFTTEGWLEFASNVNPELFKGLSINSMDSLSQFVALTPAERTEWEGLLNQNVAVQSGETALQIGYENKFPFRFMEIVGLKDGVKGRETVEKTWGLLLGKFSKLVQASLPKTQKDGQPVPVVDFTSIETAIATSKDMMATQGVIAQMRKVNQNGLDAKAVDFSVDATRMAPDDPDLLRFKEVLGDHLSGGVGFDSNNMYLAVGRDAVDEMTRVRAGSGEGPARLNSIVSGAGYDVSIAGRVSLVDAFKIAAFVVKRLQSRLPALEAMSSSPDISMVAGSRGGKIVVGSLNIPISGIAALLQPPPSPREPSAAPVPAPAPASAK